MQEGEQRLTLMFDYCVLVETHNITLGSVASQSVPGVGWTLQGSRVHVHSHGENCF